MLQSLRDETKKIAPQLNLAKEYKILDGLIGTLLGTRKSSIQSPIALARSQGFPYDPKRLDLFQKLYESLARISTPDRIALAHTPTLSFFESYFSNFIEGTEFQVEEAVDIIFKGKTPNNRPKDAYDILNTYQIISNLKEMALCPKNADELIRILKHRHAFLMQGRPELSPGTFKTLSNQAGSTLFVAPDLVEGTLRQGFQWLLGLNSPFQKAVYMTRW